MANWISGRDALDHLDSRLHGLRGRLSDAIETADVIDGRLAEIQSHRVDAVQKLTDMRLHIIQDCLLYTSPSPRDATLSRMPSSA